MDSSRITNPIRLLDPGVANKIAAGEVIERPASVVKELIENAIDAAATDIRVEIRGGGVQLIRVLDDGLGLPPEDLTLSCQRHATSKIRTTDDLSAIRTLGFRGEALASIAAVARLNLISRQPHAAVGAYVEVLGGQVVQQGHQGCPPGTAVSVHDLFANFPARLKFLKAAGTEFAHISHLVSQFAMAYPEIRFTLINDGRLAFQSAGDAKLLSVLIKVYGVTTAERMLAIGLDQTPSRGERESDYRVDGYVSQPAVTRSSRNYLSFFVNRRWVQSRSLAYAVEEAYHPFLPTGRHPVAVVNITLPFDDIDVNVHPQKTEVRFVRDREVFALVQRSVRRTITENFSMPSVISRPDFVLPEVQRHLELVDDRPRLSHTFAAPVHPDGPALVGGSVAHREPGGEPGQRVITSDSAASGAPILRVVGQIANTFIIAEGPTGMYLVDQHRAHERVLFEKLEEERLREPQNSQTLLEPLTLDLTIQQIDVLRRRLDGLAEMGFTLEPFGERTYLVRAIPAVLAGPNLVEIVPSIIHHVAEEQASGDWRRELAAGLACDGAIKAGQALSLSEMRELILQLEATKLPPKCPHGAPTMVHLSQAQLEKQFGR